MATTVSLKPNAVEISGSTSGTTTLQATAVAGTTTLTLPAATDTLVGRATTDTLTNKTLTGAVMNGTLGATTPSTGAFTTLSASGTLGVSSNVNVNSTGGTIGVYVGPSAAEASFVYNTNGNLDITPRSGFKTNITAGGLAVTGLVDISAATSGQIKFPATQNASSNANTLDDYEEGTWTPNQGAGLTVVGTFGSSGTYTKVGRIVTVNLSVTGTTSISVSAGGNICSNLPFTAIADGIGAYGSGAQVTTPTLITMYAYQSNIIAVNASGAGSGLYMTITYTEG